MSLAPDSEPPPIVLPAGAPSTARILLTVQVAVFATSLSVRAADPVIPKIAADFAMDPATVALLSTAFALPYAIVQPVMGAIADMIGKTRVMTISLVVIVISGFLAAMAPSFAVLLAARVAAGIVTGGVFPVALAIAGDLVPVARRQIVIGRLLGAAMLGNLLGSPCSGLVGDLIGWRGVFFVVACLAVAALAGAFFGFKSLITAPRKKVGLAAIAGHYRTIFGNPLAKICFSAVMLEGAFLFGIFPYVANLLAAAGETRAAIAGLVIAAFGLGGIAYTVTVPVLLRRLGEIGMMRGGALLAGCALMVVAAELPWQAQMVTFALLGYGFYSLHGVIQIYATELAPAGRGTATALHSAFFYLGQAFGPVVYRIGLASVGLIPTAAFSAGVVIATGFVCAVYLRRPRRE